MTLSTMATCAPAEVAATAPDAPRWFQLYVFRDEGVTRAIVEQAVEAGFRAIDTANRFMPPSLAHPFGTDPFGRDLWLRAWIGARISLSIAFGRRATRLRAGMMTETVSLDITTFSRVGRDAGPREPSILCGSR